MGPLRSLPSGHLPTQVEIEFTNVCNARCVACPRHDMPKYGYLAKATLERILELYSAYRNELSGRPVKVVVAGGGEPLLHPGALAHLRRIKEAGFRVSLITNASRFHTVDLDMLASVSDEILISFWGIEEDEYERSMKLDYRTVLQNVRALRAQRHRRVNIGVQCLRTEHIRSRPDQIREFWRREGIEDVRGFDSWWNRAGQVETTFVAEFAEKPHTPDFSRRVWCSDLYFSDTYTWQGDLVLCCCHFFHSEQVPLGNIESLSLGRVQKAKEQVFRDVPRAACVNCSLPRQARANQLAGELRDFMGHGARAMVFGYGGQPRVQTPTSPHGGRNRLPVVGPLHGEARLLPESG